MNGVSDAPARHVLVISDSCYSGDLANTRSVGAGADSGTPAIIARMLGRKSRNLMASGGEETVSDAGIDGHSVFAGVLLGALAEQREPAAAIYARAHTGGDGSDSGALVRTVLLPLLTDVAERCGGFDWDDAVFDHAYAELERSLFGSRRAYSAVAPLVGLGAGSQVDLGRGVRVRVAAAGELAASWPDAARLLPSAFGREPDRVCVLELERPLQAAEAEPDDLQHGARCHQ